MWDKALVTDIHNFYNGERDVTMRSSVCGRRYEVLQGLCGYPIVLSSGYGPVS